MPTVTAPAWVLPNAKIDLDFKRKRYWGGCVYEGSQLSASKAAQSLVISGGPGITDYAPDENGILQVFPAYVPRITIGRGLWMHQNRTNGCLWCRDLTNAAWVKTNVTATKNQAGAELAANSATSLTATAANATCLQTVTATVNTRVFSAYVKRLSGSGTIEMTQDNGVTWTAVTSQINSAGYKLIYIPSASVTNPVMGFRIVTSGDSIAVDFCQNEVGAYPTTPLPTTTATLARGAVDEPTFNTTSTAYNDGQRILKDIFVSGGPWSFYGEYSGNPEVGNGWFVASDGPPTISGGCNGGTFAFMGSTTSNTGVQGLGNVNKVSGRVDGFGSTGCINGGAVATYNTATTGKPYPPSTVITHCGLGNNGSGTGSGPLNGYIGRITLWDCEITDGQIIEFTR